MSMNQKVLEILDGKVGLIKRYETALTTCDVLANIFYLKNVMPEPLRRDAALAVLGQFLSAQIEEVERDLGPECVQARELRRIFARLADYVFNDIVDEAAVKPSFYRTDRVHDLSESQRESNHANNRQ